ncbi:MAG TPA: M24 family metallopeptidase [Caldilineaceae bacterium]|nr:M24 family metallopeptidase [Caldilineaceae bacterium]
MSSDSTFPQVLPMRRRAEVIYRLLKGRLATILPAAMREAGLDMWLILCHEDNLDPVYTTMIPMDTWCPILSILVFQTKPGRDGEAIAVEGINLCGTDTRDLYHHPYTGQIEAEQWPLLIQTIIERDPQRIGINIGSVAWAAGGLTQNLYQQLVEHLPDTYVSRLVSAEAAAVRWLATLTDDEIQTYEHVADVAHHIIAECYSRSSIVPNVTTTEDLQWRYWERCAGLGLPMAFKPSFRLIRNEEMRARYGATDQVIRPGDVIHCDVGFQYLRFNSDHQQVAYVRRAGEQDAPPGLKELMAQANRLQDIYMAEFRHGLTGNELLHNILARARREGAPGPKVYSHSVGLFLHEPGPLIGLPWEQEDCAGRGEVRLEYNSCFTMELSVTGMAPDWSHEEVRLPLEEEVVFTRQGCRPLDGRQTEFYLI